MATQLVQLQPGETIDRWTVVKKLGAGGFGAVYLVADAMGNHYAFKTEGVNEQIQVLKMEVYVLSELNKRNSRHFCKIEDKGRYGSFNYVVMTLVGKSLEDLMKQGPGRHFSMGTAISAGIQALEALEDLHGIGYLHRDVKPANYTVGRPEVNEVRKIYLLDFGMCRKYTNTENVIRKPRARTGFRGTVCYAPISCHLGRELCRKDDVETWIYMQVEMTTGRLPWRQVADMNQVGEYKKRCHVEPGIQELLGGCAPEMHQIMALVDRLVYYDAPPYQVIYNMMRQSFQSTGSAEFPLDWERPPPPPAGGFF